jgi:predicted NUDIX family NTP pyrophosphohydrolase
MPGRSVSSGIVLFRRKTGDLEVLLVHPGGPFWRHRDLGVWSIPKGEPLPGEDGETTARREFAEETGAHAPAGLQPLGEIWQRGGKRVEAFAAEGDFDADAVNGNTFEIEWPPHSGRMASFPEIDRAAWFPLELARQKIIAGQSPLLDRLERLCAERPD